MTIAQEQTIETLTAELEVWRRNALLAPFAHDLGQSIMTVLALIPYEAWPPEAQAAFEHESKKTPTTAAIYRAALPKAKAKA